IIPKENEKDLRDIRSNILKDIELTMVEHMDEVLREAIVSEEPVLHDIVVPPPTTIPTGEVRPNVNLS
ncbi:MAG: S16 family serine protease, partial [Thermodesulfobacteriota bacterium]